MNNIYNFVLWIFFDDVRDIEENYSKIRDVEIKLANLTLKQVGMRQCCSFSVLDLVFYWHCWWFLCMMGVWIGLSAWTYEEEDTDVDGENSCCEVEGGRSSEGLSLFVVKTWFLLLVMKVVFEWFRVIWVAWFWDGGNGFLRYLEECDVMQ
jgi:hypothetical protein